MRVGILVSEHDHQHIRELVRWLMLNSLTPERREDAGERILALLDASIAIADEPTVVFQAG